ncbi:MAG TPA: acetyl-CoA carboxylase biotin carboxyl carrier protein subunit [Propioniciclava sp.]|jgi:biotin carboxyl carrier protein|uniref:biotin/lipoyl-containing protein n=1 Tax=Propioniciclava sp. TaxID=2038686 RepID=UPI002B83EE47|nr:biotin/lipoyl-containing protein [Propioniciclava sp.]HRL48600.1 acetyl-CoA carboxylase biotin carboxyl carrier protein subunit [Propioniciclava sp.]
MRRYTITVNDTAKVVDVEALGADTFRVQLDGRLVDVRLEDHRDLAWEAPITPAIQARRTAATHGTAVVADPPPVASTAAPAAASAPAAAPARAAAPAAAGGGGRDKLTAPMPGVILTIDTTVGTSVKRGETLMVLEAMKMKNELKASKDGVVAEIYVAAGQQVKFGETLVRFEA